MPFGLAWHTVALFFGLVAFTPRRGADLAPHPRAATDYAEALARVAAMRAIEDTMVAPGGATILLTHGHRTSRSVVLLHGLTDSPLQFQTFAQQLYDGGDNVYVPRLPHHAERDGHVGAMARLTAQELRDVGDAAVDIAHGLGDTVIVSGLSAGGTIAAWVGQYRPDVQRVVLVAPALQMTHVPSMLRGAVLRLALRAPNVSRTEARDSLAPDREPGWATHAVAHTLALGAAVSDAAGARPPMARELAFLLNANDRTVASGAVFDLARRWSRHGAAVRVYEIPDTLRLPHDMIDPRHPGSNPEAVYPVLDALVRGAAPPSWVSERSPGS